MQEDYAQKIVGLIKDDPQVIGLAAAGSWITNELDEFSDLDLVLITKEKIGGDKQKMLEYADRFGNILSAFTGEHVGEPRVLICLYEDPLIHVDIKFLTLPEFYSRIENPVVLFEREGQLTSVINSTEASWPMPDQQWIEDRFWVWVHYVAAKIGRGEYFECLDGLNYFRLQVLAQLLHIKNKNQPRALRKIERKFSSDELAALKLTIAEHDAASVISALENTILMYQSLRKDLFGNEIELRAAAEKRSIEYLEAIKQTVLHRN